jgi:RNA polymerase sigma-32 factor
MGESDRWVDHAIRDQLGRSNLSAERERQLLILAQGDPNAALRQAALTELWESHSKLVIAIASRHRRAGFDLLDLVGAGHLGLHAAIERFDPNRFQSRLSAYAVSWIRWYIQDYIRRNTIPVRLPTSNAHRQLSQNSARLLAEARRRCEREGVEPTEAELATRIGERIGLPPDEVAHVLQVIRGGTLSLHQTGPNETGMPPLEETLADESHCPEDAAILRLDQAKLRKRVVALVDEILGERERIVFLSRCLADPDEIVHLDVLATRFGVSRERVYQLEASAKRKIMTALTQEGFGGMLGSNGDIQLPQTRARRRRAQPAARRREVLAVSAAAD